MRLVKVLWLLLALHSSAAAQIKVANAASFEEFRPLAPGSIAAAFGSFGGVTAAFTPGQPLPTTLAGVGVTVDGLAAGLYAVTPAQVNFLIPLEVRADIDERTAMVKFKLNGSTLGSASVRLRDVSPVVFSSDASNPLRPSIALDRAGRRNSENNPARPGEVLEFFAMGHGAKLISPLEIFPPTTSVQPLVFFRTWLGETVSSVLAPGRPGLWLIRVRVPEAEGLRAGPTPVVVAMDGLSSNMTSVWIAR